MHRQTDGRSWLHRAFIPANRELELEKEGSPSQREHTKEKAADRAGGVDGRAGLRQSAWKASKEGTSEPGREGHRGTLA